MNNHKLLLCEALVHSAIALLSMFISANFMLISHAQA